VTDLELFDLYKNSSIEGLSSALGEACISGNLSEIKFLLTSPLLSIHANIHHYSENALFHACDNEHLDVIHYLLTSPELNEHADIHADDAICFTLACEYNRINVIKYLLTTPELKDKIDIHAYDDKAFNIAITESHDELLRFFIFDMKIEKTLMINLLLDTHKESKANHFFELRELNDNLNIDLIPSSTIKGKIKL